MREDQDDSRTVAPLLPNHLSADRPLQFMKDDLLGRGDFAIGMANTLTSWRGDESLVVALYGPWGSGKTSVKNFILECIVKDEKPLTVVEFNPWGWSGQETMKLTDRPALEGKSNNPFSG